MCISMSLGITEYISATQYSHASFLMDLFIFISRKTSDNLQQFIDRKSNIAHRFGREWPRKTPRCELWISGRIIRRAAKFTSRVNYTWPSHDGRENRDARAIRENAESEFWAVGTMANHEEHSGNRLRFHGELYRFHGSGELAELDQRWSITGHVHSIGDLWQSSLQQHFSTRSDYKVRAWAIFYIHTRFIYCSLWLPIMD